MIGKAFRAVWQALKDTWGDLFMLSVLNFVWFLASFSGLFIASLGASLYPGLLTLVTFPVATAAIYPISYRVASGKAFHLSDYWDAVKAYWWRALLWFLVNILVAVLWYVNLDFYAQLIRNEWVLLIGGFWTSIFAVWLMAQMHFWPMMMVQEKPSILHAWRNGALLVLRFPVFSILIGIIGVLLAVLSTALIAPLFLFLMSLLSVLFCNATLTLLVEIGLIEKDYRPDYTR